MNQVIVRFIILKYGKLLLSKTSEQEVDSALEKNKWALIGGLVHPSENLDLATNRVLVDKCGWESKNIRLFQVNTYTDEDNKDNHFFEVVFIVDADKNVLSSFEKKSGLRWFQLNDLPFESDIDSNQVSIIMAFKKLVHGGKTLDLEMMPPVFNLKKSNILNEFKLIGPKSSE